MKCDRCKDGNHVPGIGGLDGCRGGWCKCYCTLPSHPHVVRHRTVLTISARCEHALSILRDEGVEVRTRRNGTLVWKPAPANMPEQLLKLVRTHRFELTKALAAFMNPWPVARQGWGFGGVQACEQCGRGTVAIDPLGHPRHSWCGWVGQVPIIEPIVQVPCWPANLSEGAA